MNSFLRAKVNLFHSFCEAEGKMANGKFSITININNKKANVKLSISLWL